jgi:hypothetical protein
MLYIPLDSEYNTPVSLKRSLSDPEIYFPSPAVRHSLIVAVNGLFGRDTAAAAKGQSSPHSASNSGKLNHSGSAAVLGNGGGHNGDVVGGGRYHHHPHYHHHHHHYHHRPHLLTPSSPNSSSNNNIGNGNSNRLTRLKLGGIVAASPGEENLLTIDINVIQPTPNISPSASLRSMSGESRDLADPSALLDPSPPSTAYAGIPFLVVPPSPVRVRRVSFSENDDDVSFAEEDDYDEEDLLNGCHARTPMLVVTSSSSAAAAAAAKCRQQSLPTTSSSSGLRGGGGGGDSETSRRRSRCKRQSSLQVYCTVFNEL